MNANKITNTIRTDDLSGLAEGSPFNVLENFCRHKFTGRLQLFDRDTCYWTIRLEAGKITYVTHSVEPFDRLVCQMRTMSQQAPQLTKELRAQTCLMFEDATPQADENEVDESYRCNDYIALCWLVNQQHLTLAQASRMTESMIKEALEPLLWLDKVTYRFVKNVGTKMTFFSQEFMPLALYCQKRLKLWQLLSPQVWSPYQRPYFFGQTDKQKNLLPELHLSQKFSTILKGFSFRHLAVLLNKDELKIVGGLMPYICEEVIVLRDPQPPYNLLPKIPTLIPEGFHQLNSKVITNQLAEIDKTEENPIDAVEFATPSKTYTIACVDDSPTILTEIKRFLDDHSCEVIAIGDPLKAPIQVLKAKPDLILLDVNMPKVNGYELCRLLRKNTMLKNTPIIMVTGNTGIIDRAKASLSGATDYLTKPFTQQALVKMVFRYLT